MTKYRIRLSNGRVIGPFEKHQLFELKTKGHIKGDEEAQIFPTGNWASIETFDFFSELMDENRTVIESASAPKEETFVIDLNKLRNQKQEKEIEELDHGTMAPVEQLTETIRMTPTEQKASLAELDDLRPELSRAPDGPEAEENDDHNKTIINPVAQQEIERMRRNQREEAEKVAAEEARKKKIEEEEKQLALVLSLENALVSSDESTQMIKVDSLALLENASEAELDIEEEIKIIQKRKAKEETEEDGAEEETDDGEAKKAKKKKLIIIGAAVLLALVFLFPKEEEKKRQFQHLEPKIIFPIPYDQADEKKSQAEFNRGVSFFNKGTYANLIRAGLSFKNSYENNLDNVPALNLMVRTYAEQLKHSKDKLQDAQILFNIIQSKRPFLSQDPNGVIGMNIFYMTINKPNAAVDVVQKYLKLRPKDISQDLFAVHLQSLIKKGKIDQAKQFYLALEKAPDKNPYVYGALIEYLLLNQESDKALEYVEDALKKYPHIVSFYLLKAELLVKQRKVEEAVPFLKKAEEMNFDYNNLNRAKFFELKGLVYAMKNKPKEATKFLSASLKLNESDQLRLKLAELESSSGTSDASRLIQESKAIKFLLQAKDFYERKNYELALSSAARAADALPGHIPSELFVAKVQLKLGMAQQGLKTLEALVAKQPDDKTINMALIDAYIETYKFQDAKNRIQVVSGLDYRDSWEYASANAKLFSRLGDKLQAMSWLKNSISINPLNDADIYALSEILLKKANFDSARVLLNKCMELDPVNPDYRIAYARLIYETQDDLAAIGYLLSIQDEFADDPKIMSEIAIFYYRSGKVKDFQDYKARLEKHYSQDKSLYEFLIKAALLDERNAEVPLLVEKLLTIEPGDLEHMMTAGRVLFEDGKLVEAAKWFKRVQDRLPSYPQVLFYIAKIDFLSGDLEGAMKKIQQDIKENGENDADLVFMAQIHQAKEEFVEAENLYKRAQKLNPKSYDAIVGLADLSTKRNNHDLALDLYKRAMKLKPEEAVVHKKIGDVYRQLGQGALAIEAYKLYLDMDPESPHKRNLEAYINLMK